MELPQENGINVPTMAPPLTPNNEFLTKNNSENKIVLKMKRKNPSEELQDPQTSDSKSLSPQKSNPQNPPIENNIVPAPQLASTDSLNPLAEKRRKLEEELAKYEKMISQIDKIKKAQIAAAQEQEELSAKNSNSPPNANNNQTAIPILDGSASKIYSDDGTTCAIFDVAWPLLHDGDTRQTIYYMENDKPQKGSPPHPNYVTALRGTKGIFVYPPFVLQIIDSEGNRSTEKERIKMTLVGTGHKDALATGKLCM